MLRKFNLGSDLFRLRKSIAILLSLSLSSPLPVLAQSQTNPCRSDSTQVPELTSSLMQAATWIADPGIIMGSLVASFGPQVSAYLTPSPWPSIQERARLARVPVMMYHDILAQKEVFFDVTPAEFEQQLQLIKTKGLTPISLNQLTVHLQTGLPLPGKPILLTFDDGYGGHYEYVFPLLKKYGYPAVFSIYTSKVGDNAGRSHVNWDQLRQMSADPLITVAAHSITHPRDLTELPDDKLRMEVIESKRLLEAQLGIPIRYFTYPEGNYDQRVARLVREAGYLAALTMDKNEADEGFAEQSESLLAVKRFGQSRLEDVIAQAWGGPELPKWGKGFDFSAPVERTETMIDQTPLILISGGRPITVHAKTRSQVQQIVAGTKAVAAVDGGFFSMEQLNSNVMIGPVLSQSTGKFIPGNASENLRLIGRPLVLISSQTAKFVAFDPFKHNSPEGIQADMPDATDAFVAAAWLVKDSQPQMPITFGSLFDFDAARHRAFWGINRAGQPTIGVSVEPIDSVGLGTTLAKAGFQDAIMLDSGASTSLAYKGESLVGYIPRPVPHVVALVPPPQSVTGSACREAFQ